MSTSQQSKPPRHNFYPPWAPRFWNGMKLGSFFSLLKENRFQISPSRYPMTGIVGMGGVMNSLLGGVQSVCYGRRIRETELVEPPIFVIGHWRSGTTLMHELLALDSGRAFPTNFDTFIPHHFLVSRFFFYPLVKLLMPAKRPMDNMTMGVGSPQEDDFALCTVGAPTPYRRIAFPNRPSREHWLLDIDQASDSQLERLEGEMKRFLKTLTVRYQAPLVLKSPPHTGRIAKLAEWFPGARFVHLSRHPYQLVPSTIRLWTLLDKLHGFQVPRYDQQWMKNYIFECQDLMYGAYDRHRSEIPAHQLIEIKFEELVAEPVEQVRRVYEQLELSGFEELKPKIERYFEQRRGHKKNRHQLDESLRLEIDSHWAGYMKMFGY